MKKYFGFYLALILFLSACMTSTSETTSTPFSTLEPDSAILSTVPSAQATMTEVFIPKPNDLIFIEFFAVT